MEALFLKVLNMSVTASYVIAVVLLLRFLLRKAPKKISYLLWSVVAFRLCCPFTWQSVFSLFSLKPLTAASTQVGAGGATSLEHIPSTFVTAAPPQVSTGLSPTGSAPSVTIPAAAPTPNIDPLQIAVTVAAVIWCAGMAALLITSVVSYLKMRRQMETAVLLRDNIYQSERVRSPFILGFVRPKIYIPYGLDAAALNYVLEHERYHIKRRDYLIKPFAFLLLTVHWFNPLCWLSFHLMGKDMEMSCDEKVLAGETGIAKAYSTLLLSFAANRRFPAPGPLAFGETGVKSRIKNALRWKKPKTYVTLLAAVLCVLAVVACAANPAQQPDPGSASDGERLGEYASMEDYANEVLRNAIGSEVTYYSYLLTENGVENTEATARVLDAKVAWLEQTGELAGLAPDGTLESWRFNYLVQIDADPANITLPGGMSEKDGWYDLEGQGGHNVIALRYEDGSYLVLESQPVNDGMDFYGYHTSYEEALYDWYISASGLDLPPYVIDLLPRDELGTHPARRYDGDGWYIYIPIQAWEQTEASESRTVWSSEYGTGSILTVQLTSGSEMAMSHPWIEGQEEYYFESPNGTWCVFTSYTPENITDYPYIAIEPDVLQAMARSFTVDAGIADPYTPDESGEDGTVPSAELIERMATLTAADIMNLSGNFDGIRAEEFVTALNAASRHSVARDESMDPFFWNFFDLDVSLIDVNSTYEERLWLSAGLEENIVRVIYFDGNGNSETGFFQDAPLYWMLRNSYSSEGVVDWSAYAEFRDIIEARAQKYVDQSKQNTAVSTFTGYTITEFRKVDTFEDDSGTYEVFVWNPAFTVDDPVNVEWAGGMYLDSQLRVCAYEEYTYFVARRVNGQVTGHRFLFWDLYYGPDEETERSNAWASIQSAFGVS